MADKFSPPELPGEVLRWHSPEREEWSAVDDLARVFTWISTRWAEVSSGYQQTEARRRLMLALLEARDDLREERGRIRELKQSVATAEDRQANAERAAVAALRHEHIERRPARELLEVAHDCYIQGYVAALDSAEVDSADALTAHEAWHESEAKRVLEEPGAEYVYDFGPGAVTADYIASLEGVLTTALRLLKRADGLFYEAELSAELKTFLAQHGEATAHPHAPAGGAAESDG